MKEKWIQRCSRKTKIIFEFKKLNSKIICLTGSSSTSRSEKMGLMLDNFWLRRVKRTNDTSLERKWSGASNKKGFKWFWLLSTEKSSFNMTSSTMCKSVSKFWQTIQRRSCVCVIYTLRIKQDRVDLKFKLAKYKWSKKWSYQLVSYILLLSVSTHTHTTQFERSVHCNS